MIRVAELFAGVGGFRIGFERASESFETVWSNQWEPSTKKQDASEIYQKWFGSEGHSNETSISARLKIFQITICSVEDFLVYLGIPLC
jgi:site-specific DNA-cytosine methylase